MNPDIYSSISLANNGTTTVAVTKKPQIIIMFVRSGTSSYGDFMGIYDCNNNTGKRCGRYGGASHNFENWTDATNYLTSITSSSVTIKNVIGGSSVIYYEMYY